MVSTPSQAAEAVTPDIVRVSAVGVLRRASRVVLMMRRCLGGGKDLEDGNVCFVEVVQDERRAGDYHFNAGDCFPWNTCVVQLVR